ncbi:hypothetical protein DFH09DRAFT_1079309 [Mycena vulgaris]|nr:hypothetical protein DFH09DRAFT_1079309 [Mycena vulgaris]
MFIYFLLYVQHKSQPKEDRVEMDLSSWIKYIWGELSTRVPFRGKDTDDLEDILFYPLELTIVMLFPGQLLSGGNDCASKGGVANAAQSEGSDLRVRRKSPMGEFFRKIVLVLGSLHLSLKAALGIWLWRDPASFAMANTCPVNTTADVVTGDLFTVPRTWPQSNPSGGAFLGLFLGYQEFHWRASSGKNLQPSPLPIAPKDTDTQDLHPSIVPVIIGMVLLFTINVIFLFDIKLTLQHARSSQDSAWSFGQILALLLLGLPMRDLVETISDETQG